MDPDLIKQLLASAQRERAAEMRRTARLDSIASGTAEATDRSEAEAARSYRRDYTERGKRAAEDRERYYGYFHGGSPIQQGVSAARGSPWSAEERRVIDANLRRVVDELGVDPRASVLWERGHPAGVGYQRDGVPYYTTGRESGFISRQSIEDAFVRDKLTAVITAVPPGSIPVPGIFDRINAGLAEMSSRVYNNPLDRFLQADLSNSAQELESIVEALRGTANQFSRGTPVEGVRSDRAAAARRFAGNR